MASPSLRDPLDPLDPLDRRILARLATTESLSTTGLATDLDEKRDRVYRHCCHMESDGFVESSLVDGPILRYCLKHRRIVVGDFYLRCKKQRHPMRVIKVERRMWSAKPRRRRR